MANTNNSTAGTLAAFELRYGGRVIEAFEFCVPSGWTARNALFQFRHGVHGTIAQHGIASGTVELWKSGDLLPWILFHVANGDVDAEFPTE